MSQDASQPDPPAKISIGKNPTPSEEETFFSSADEKRQAMSNKHELDVHDRKAGIIGKATGSTNASLNIAFVIAVSFLAAMIFCLIGALFSANPLFSQHIEKIIAAILAVAGFIFGVQQGAGKDK